MNLFKNVMNQTQKALEAYKKIYLNEFSYFKEQIFHCDCVFPLLPFYPGYKTF